MYNRLLGTSLEIASHFNDSHNQHWMIDVISKFVTRNSSEKASSLKFTGCAIFSKRVGHYINGLPAP